MEIFLNILFLALGMVFLIKGADLFVNGASGIAKKLKVSPFVIGATIVAIGTSLPELTVSVVSAIHGSTDMALGNVVGSNMFNMLMALGITALICPVLIKDNVKKIDAPVLIIITACLLIFSYDRFLNGYDSNFISRTESLILLGIVGFYLYINIKNARKMKAQDDVVKNIEKLHKQQEKAIKQSLEDGEINTVNQQKIDALVEKTVEAEENAILISSNTQTHKHTKITNKTWFLIVNLLIGLAGVVFGGECVSSTAKFLALKIGMSEMLVGVTIVAIGTSLPELIVSIVSAKSGNTDIALGNVIGSNIVNIGLVLALSGIFKFIPLTTAGLIDLIILFVSTFILCAFIWWSKKIGRLNGTILTLLYIAYMVYSCVRN